MPDMCVQLDLWYQLDRIYYTLWDYEWWTCEGEPCGQTHEEISNYMNTPEYKKSLKQFCQQLQCLQLYETIPRTSELSMWTQKEVGELLCEWF